MKKYLHELYKRKDLINYLFVTGLKAQHRNTYLGYIWWILDPLLMGMVYYFLRVVILGMEGENVGAFLIIGLVAWKWTASVVTASARSISSREGIITQVYLPKAIFPLGAVLTQLANFVFSLVVIAFFLAFYRVVPGFNLLWLPLIMAVQFIFLTAAAMVLAYICMFIRDIENVITHLMRFWFYASPVIWETGRLPERFNFLLNYNPAAAFIVSYRNIFMYHTEPQWWNLIIITLISLLVILYMIAYYDRNEHKIIRSI